MPRVLVQPTYGNPIGRRNAEATVHQPVPLGRIAPLVDPADLESLRRAHPGGRARLSGIAARHGRLVSQLAPGDHVVFTGQRAVRAVGRIAVLLDTTGFSGVLWEDQRGGCAHPLGYSLAAFAAVEVPYEAIWALPGFTAGDMFMGARLLDAERSAAVLGLLPDLPHG